MFILTKFNCIENYYACSLTINYGIYFHFQEHQFQTPSVCIQLQFYLKLALIITLYHDQPWIVTFTVTIFSHICRAYTVITYKSKENLFIVDRFSAKFYGMYYTSISSSVSV